MTVHSATMLVGRAGESARIGALLDEARAGRGGVLVIHGEPGIGKTSLLEHAADRAAGMRIVRVRGVETETSLPFAGLVDLLTPLTEYLPEVSERQADAVRGALAIGPTRQADRLAVLTGAFNLLCAAATASPLLVLVDDAQWLDPASSEAITFAARRIGADRIAVLIATREDGYDGMPAVRLRPLTAGQSSEVLEGRGLDPGLLDSAVRGAEGNPLALLELARSGNDRFEPGYSTLEQEYARMAATLPNSCRNALHLLAATRSSSPVVIGRALAGEGLTDAAFAPAERNGMVTVDSGRIGFRHPLIRSGVYTSASAADRRRAHAALAAACVEPELEWERVAHLAAAAPGPDEDLADAVERLAADVRLRGGSIAAAEWYERSAALSLDPARRRRRLLAAAEAAHTSGQAQVALRILDDLEPECRDPNDVARVELLRGRIEARCGSTAAAGTRFLRAARRLEHADPPAAAALFIESVDPSIRAGRPHEALDAARRALALSPPGDQLGLAARIAQAASLVFLGDAAGAERDIDEAADELARTPTVQADLQLRAYLGMSLAFAERVDRARRVLDELIDECEQSAPGALTYPLISRSWLRRFCGAWAGAQADAQRAVRLAQQLGRAGDECWGLSVLTWIMAVQGRLDEELLDHQQALSDRLDLPYQGMCVNACRGVHALASGAAENAARELGVALAIKRRCGIADATTQPVIGADLVEALVRCGRLDEATEQATALSDSAVRAGRGSAYGLAERAQALVAKDGMEHFARSWELQAGAPDRFARARTALAWGDALRRDGQRVRSRELLEYARGQFDVLGALAWEEQAASGLARSGMASRRGHARRDELTPAELEVAGLAAEGKTNREIAGTLWMSEKTVEAHLTRIYRKLGVRNRAELAGRGLG
jgi:DNA-binding CsgD family transcriptional regulator